jgi:hypothetical protein
MLLFVSSVADLADTSLQSRILNNVFFFSSKKKYFFIGVTRLAADGINICLMAAIGCERWPNNVLTGKIAYIF